MNLDVIIPGRAFEIATGSNKLDSEVIQKLQAGERRNKGRGYRVFTKLNKAEATKLAKFYADIDVTTLSLVDAQAVRNASSRLHAAAGIEVITSPRVEEKIALKKLKQKQKSVENRGRKMREKTAKEIWSNIFPLIETRHCHCGLKPGMSLKDLRELGAGCTDPYDYKHKVLGLPRNKNLSPMDRIVALGQTGHVCSVLDTYRRAVEKLNPPKEPNYA